MLTAAAHAQAADQTRLPDRVVLRTIGVSNGFGSLLAVDNLDIDVRQGEVLGFLGPNGSGKSTTVGMILGLIAPTTGRIEFEGLDLARHRPQGIHGIGAIIESPAFYPYLSGRDNLRALALAIGDIGPRRVDDLLTLVGLGERAGDAYKTYSLGMKQRLGIASTLLTDPKLVVLDEPTNGLDPAGQREIRELIPRLAHEGHAVLLASHLLNEVEQVCDRVAIIRRGRLLQIGTVTDLLRRGAFIEVTVPPADLTRAAATLRDLPCVGRVTIANNHLQVLAREERGSEINRALANASIYATSIIPKRSTLEDVFLELTGAAEPSVGGHERAAVAA
jgi:ABC-2 type transport system ATP-binding protein